MNDCVFCKLIKGEIERNFLYEDSDCVVFNSNQPVAEHHLLVVPKKHMSDFLELDGIIEPMVKTAQKMIRDLGLTEGYKLVFNGGKYISVPHVHLHILAGKLELDDDILSKT